MSAATELKVLTIRQDAAGYNTRGCVLYIPCVPGVERLGARAFCLALYSWSLLAACHFNTCTSTSATSTDMANADLKSYDMHAATVQVIVWRLLACLNGVLAESTCDGCSQWQFLNVQLCAVATLLTESNVLTKLLGQIQHAVPGTR